MNRRKILIDFGRLGLLAGTTSVLGGLAGGAGVIAPAWAQDGGLPERALGSPEAEITIIEYASLTCPHCAHFHEDTYPELKTQWIDSGKARFVYRHFPLDGLALRASALAECMEGERFFGFLDLLFASQQSWSRASDPIKALQNLAKQAGMDEATSEACLTDDAVITQVLTQRQQASAEFGIESTPSFIVNDKKIAGAIGYGEFDEFLSGLL
jgi:protein-disulfide isomerase